MSDQFYSSFPTIKPMSGNGLGGGIAVAVDTDAPDAVSVDPKTGTVETRLPDGNLSVEFGVPEEKEGDEDFDANLALEMPQGDLSTIASDLMEGIELDLDSSKEWRQIYAKGIDILAIRIEQPRGAVGTSSAAVDGMSSYRDPLLLEGVLRAHATAAGELLPAQGPVKVRNDGDGSESSDVLADALEKDLNHWLTVDATEYYPDSDRGLLITVYCGLGIKKGYHCPIRRRPVIEFIDPDDFIISDAMTDLQNADRVTHVIKMPQQTMKRMRLEGIYRDDALTQPMADTGVVTQKIAQVQGTSQGAKRPQDEPYTLYECRCFLDLPEYAPEKFKEDGVPLPYRVTLDKDSKTILEIRRDWKEDDEECKRCNRYIKYSYVPGFGFYPIGLMQIMGNTTNAMTAARREMLDAGMYANFPSGIMAKGLGRQDSNEIRMSPGSLAPVDTNGQKIQDSVMFNPYKDVTPGLMQLTKDLRGDAQRLGAAAEQIVGEGRQDAPVGTTLALIEQATKVESEVHKRFCQAQSEEFRILKELFEEDPEAFWRHNPNCAGNWNVDKFLAALKNCSIVPVADPNTPSHLHRLMKAVALKQLEMAAPNRYDGKEVDRRILRMMGWNDPDSLFAPEQAPAPPPPDPKLITAQARMVDAQSKAAKAMHDIQGGGQELEARKDLATVDLAKELVIHSADQVRQQQKAAIDAAKEASKPQRVL